MPQGMPNLMGQMGGNNMPNPMMMGMPPGMMAPGQPMGGQAAPNMA